MSRQDTHNVYAAAESREFLNNSLDGKSNEWINEFAGLIDDSETLDLLNHYCSLWQDTNENFLETRMAHIIITNAATDTIDGAFRSGNVSQLKGAIGLTDNSQDAGDALGEIGRRLSDEGCIAFIVGPPGSGKTALMVDICRLWAARTGGSVFSNLDWSGSDGLILTDRDMFESMAGVEGPTLGALDELSTELTGRGADSKKAESFARALTLVRKMQSKHGRYAKRGSVLGVAHTKRRLAASLRRMATLVIQKPSRNDQGRVVLYESEGGADDLEKIGEYKGLTDTRETYGEHEASSFDVVGDADDGEGDNEQIDVADLERNMAIETALKAAKPWADDDGMTYREAGELVGYSRNWVGERVAEWRAGEHDGVKPENG